jgi:hypothetical protein
MESSSAAINILKPEEQSAQLACQLFFADYDLSGYGILRLETLRQQAPCRVIPDTVHCSSLANYFSPIVI